MRRFVGVSQHSYVKLNTVLKTQKVTSVVFVEVRYLNLKARVLDNFTSSNKPTIFTNNHL